MLHGQCQSPMQRCIDDEKRSLSDKRRILLAIGLEAGRNGIGDYFRENAGPTTESIDVLNNFIG